MSNKPSSNTAFKRVKEYIGLYTDYRKPLAIEALNLIQEELKDSKKKYDELFRMTRNYVKLLHKTQEENKKLLNQIEGYKEILETRQDHEARADEIYLSLKEENRKLKEIVKVHVDFPTDIDDCHNDIEE